MGEDRRSPSTRPHSKSRLLAKCSWLREDLKRSFAGLILSKALFSLVLLGFLFSPAQAQVSFFTNPPTFAAGRSSPSLPLLRANAFAADLNLDGKLDLVAADGTVLLGKGNATFTTGTKVSLTSGTSIVGVGDFNGDGKPDLLAVNGFNLLVFLGNGDGTFQSPKTSFVAASYASFFVGDVNGDGKSDVLGFNANAGFTVFLGKGDGTLTIGQSYFVSSVQAMVTGDFNGDHKLDIAVAAGPLNGTISNVDVLLGNGDGTFKNPVISAGVFSTILMVAGDVNGDGKLDLIVGSAYPFTLIGGFQMAATLLGNGDGSFQAPIPIAPAPPASSLGVFGTTLVLEDVNGDGRLDMVVLSVGLGFIQVLLGNGSGSSFSESGNYYLLNGGDNLIVADFNNDHEPDIVSPVSDGSDNAYMLLGNGDGTFRAPQNLAEGVVAAGDFNGDGISDLAVLFSPALQIYLGNHSGVLSLANSYSFSELGISVVTADVNGDGKPDLVTWGQAGVAVVLGNGDGTFQSPIVSSGCAPPNWSSGIGDFNNDHKLDLAFVDTSSPGGGNSLYLCLGNGDGSFGALTSAAFAGTGTNSLALGDFNNDGNLDAAVGSNAGLAILLGKGDGTFQAPNFILQSYAFVAAPADYNGDGKLDLVVSGFSGGTTRVYLGNGDGTFKAVSQPNLPLSTLPFSPRAADLNGDGKLDLVGSSSVGPAFQVNLGMGDGTFGPRIALAVAHEHDQILGGCESTGCGIGVGDFNGDKLPDLAVPWGAFSVSEGGVAIFLNTTPAGGTTDMGLSVGSGGSSSATVTAGQTASYTLSIGGKGWSGQTSLSCSGVPSGASCSVTPSSVAVNAINPASITVSVLTAARTMSLLKSKPNSHSPWVWAMALLAIVIVPGSWHSRFSGSKLIRTTPVTMLLLLCSCGGGSGSSQQGTPAGTYTVTVTASSGSLSQSLPLTLTVQ